MKIKFMAALIAVATIVAVSTPSEARQNHRHRATAARPRAVLDVAAIPAYGPQASAPQPLPMGKRMIAPVRSYDFATIRLLPNPSGCRRIQLSCACRLAAYWGLGGGLDAVSTWPKRFRRVSGPAIGVAVVRPGHIMGIIGGGPGAWRVADFNSGRHLNREYTTSGFGRVIFVDPHSPRSANR